MSERPAAPFHSEGNTRRGGADMAGDGTRRDYGLETRLLHGTRPAHQTAPVAPPIYQTSTFQVGTPEEAADMAVAVAPPMYYARLGTPNTKQVEAMVAELEG